MSKWIKSAWLKDNVGSGKRVTMTAGSAVRANRLLVKDNDHNVVEADVNDTSVFGISTGAAAVNGSLVVALDGEVAAVANTAIRS